MIMTISVHTSKKRKVVHIFYFSHLETKTKGTVIKLNIYRVNECICVSMCVLGEREEELVFIEHLLYTRL